MAGAHRTIFLAANAQQAHILKNALDDEGIWAFVIDEFGEIEQPAGSTPVKVVVHEEDAEEARAIADEFAQTLRETAVGEASDEQEEAWDAAEARLWPRCPRCERPRHTSCPVCETAGSSFPQAFKPDLPNVDGAAESATGMLLICPTCDEPFTPQFLARCEWCGHRFGDGRELPPPAPLAVAEANQRVWIAMALLVLFVAAAFAFFARFVSPPN